MAQLKDPATKAALPAGTTVIPIIPAECVRETDLTGWENHLTTAENQNAHSQRVG